ncbi:Uncharacterized protein SCF082_LOCUS33445 [Durusdinium trenchii]|uniref:Uncharacterized protein n=1 Tax=Durusdinium trenchii TaxID=1381693 RepID=A0ABP0NAY7_9DINO
MTTLVPDSFRVSALGAQADSTKRTGPAHSFGTAKGGVKVFISKKLAKSKIGVGTPGPVYHVPSTVGAAPSFSFGSDEARKHPSAKYPDSSVDLTSATVDTQKVKFHSTPQVHLGSEDRSSLKNAEILRTNAELAMGMESPSALEYFPKEIHKTVPAYSFASKMRKPKEETRVQTLQLGSPRTLGPGSHAPATSLGNQPTSPRRTAPAWSMSGKSPRNPPPTELLAIEDKVFSSIGKQVLSTIRSPPGVGVAKSTRDQSNRTALYVSDMDRPAMGPKPTFHMDLPVKSSVARPGL